LGTPLAAAICVYLVRSSIPLKWAFGAFYTDFSSAVQRSRVAGPTLPSNSNAGPYTLERRILTTDGTIYFAVSGDSQRDSAFFVYVPDQAIAAHDQLRTEGVVWKRLRRNWYLCIRSK
jgi:hypothetical protein